ncbi:MAG: NfeD family protein [Candidatus Fermentibacteraceae bacterium]|nr:NfeD family protein [Candidatus Fermentibacteraceae bacterium]
MTGLSVTAMWAAGITVFAVAAFLLVLGLKAQKRPNQTGDSTMIGETGIVRKTSGFRNRLVVEVRGEQWWSKMIVPGGVSPGSEIKVTGVDPDDLILIVEPLERR